MDHHAQRTRSNQPRLIIDPTFVQHCLPHHNPEENSRPDGWFTTSVSSPPTYTSAMSPYSNASSASTSGPHTPDEDDSCWNLIPYDVPWGPDYFAYQAGKLPGPEGECLFLRSPTPVDKRRTVRACEKCRERKAKCSGDRPACVRCLEKGRTCVYTSDSRRSKVPTSTRSVRPKEHVPMSPRRRRQEAAEHSSPASSMSSLDSFESMSSVVLTPKQEDEDTMAPLSRSSPLSDSRVVGGDAFYSDAMIDRGFCKPQSSPQAHFVGSHGAAERTVTYQHVTGNGELFSLPPNHTSSLAAAIIAPKPVRRVPSPPSLVAAPCDAAARTYPTAVAYDPQTGIDPSTLLHGYAVAPSTQPVEFFSGDAAQHLFPTLMTADPSATSYHQHLEYSRNASMHDGVSIYFDAEFYKNPAASHLDYSSYAPYEPQYRHVMDPPAYPGSAVYAY